MGRVLAMEDDIEKKLGDGKKALSFIQFSSSIGLIYFEFLSPPPPTPTKGLISIAFHTIVKQKTTSEKAVVNLFFLLRQV